jgi:hypothetical protein
MKVKNILKKLEKRKNIKKVIKILGKIKLLYLIEACVIINC